MIQTTTKIKVGRTHITGLRIWINKTKHTAKYSEKYVTEYGRKEV